jgi:GT2 family glycosyltransferase
MTSFSVIIVTWNGLHHLKRFLPSVCATDFADYEVILADNQSEDGTAEWVSENFPETRIVRMEKNYGYCGGNNRAAHHAKNDILVFLNNDAGVDSKWLHHAAIYFESNPSVTALQPKILSSDNPSMFEYAGAAGGYLDRFCYPYCRGRVFDVVEKDYGQYDTSHKIFWASGAALFVRRETFEKLGGFAESFEFHMEEIDLCWRIQKDGGSIGYCPASVVYHLGGGSLDSDNPRKVYYNFRNNLLMLVRNHRSRGFIITLSMRIILDKIAMFHFLLRGRPKHAFAVLRALFGFIKLMPEALRFRKNNASNQNLCVDLAPYSVVYQYFIKKRRLYSELPI